MNRREGFLALVVLAVGPRVGRSQQPRKKHVVGILSATVASNVSAEVDAFRTEMRRLGWGEGDNVVIAIRGAGGSLQRMKEIALDFARMPVDVIVSLFTPATRAALDATATIPIVFTMVADPVGSGFVASLARPGGNATGLTNIVPQLAGKVLELLKEVAPGLSRVALLWNPTEPANVPVYREAAAIAPGLGIALVPIEVREAADLEPAFAQIRKQEAQALYLIGDRLTAMHRRQIADLAADQRLPTVFSLEAYVSDGGLMFYGPSFRGSMQRAASYVDKILRGAAPGDLPVEQPWSLDLIINLKTARRLGIAIPQSVRMRASRTIQ